MNPSMLIATLDSLRGRVRRLTTLYGLGVVLIILGAAFVALAGLDWFFHLSSMWRLVLLIGGIALLTGAIIRHVAVPLRSALPLTDVAGRIEKVFPQFEDRLRSAVGFIQSPTPDSPQMQQATIEQAVNLASMLPLRSVIDPRPALRTLIVGLALAVAICSGVAVLSPGTRGILVSRVFNPFTTAQWPKSVQIAMVKPIASRVPVGGRVEVEMRLERGNPSRVRPIVYFQTDNGGTRQEYLTRADDGRFTASLDARTEAATKGGAMTVWIVAGDDETTPSHVEIVPKLAVENFAANVTAPPYVGNNAPASYDLLSQQATGLVGAGVDLTVKFTKKIPNVGDIKLIPLDDGAAPTITWTAIDDRTARGSFRLDKTMKFRVDATDVDGFATSESGAFEVIAQPDQLPTATIENPRRSEERTPESVVPLAGLVEDDIAVRDASLVVTRVAGGSNQTWTIPLMVNGTPAPTPDAALAWARLDDVAGRSRSRVQYGWSLQALQDAKLKPGDVLEYGLRVADNYELDGQRHPAVDSSKLRISIISQDDLSNRVADELRAVRTQVEQVKQKQDQTAGETESFKSDVKGKPELDTADMTVATRLQQQQSSAASAAKASSDRLDDVAKMLEENRSPSTELQQLASDVRDRLSQTVEGSMKDSMQQMASASRKETPDPQRQESLERTGASQKQTSAELAEALRRLDEAGSLNAAIDQLQKMLDAQREISKQTSDLASKNAGKSPENMSAADRKKMSDLASQQAKLSEQSAKALDRLGKTADQLAKSDPASADAMRAAQKQGQKASVSPNQKQASQQINQNKSAKQQQQQAEQGLEQMLNELREAQLRKLAELQKKLAELQAQIEILIRRQSGHNLDNLTLRGPDVASANAKLITELSTKGGRKPTDAKPDAGRLLAGQGQTERNTRDIATKAASLPDGAEPASRLTRAATLMERAAVNIRDNKLAEAYEPPQVDALATLEEAKRLVDAQKDKADAAADKQQREAIRAAYVRIRTDEEKLTEETKRLEGARNDKGELNRADAVRLGQLPTEQQKLVDDVAKVGENLLKLNSTVYTWANKEISSGMSDVKSALAASRTNAVTQSREQQVIDDLTAMIENLKVDPLENKFASQSGGGGGGGGGEKPLPPEAELRLMRSLQDRVNKATRTTAEAKLEEERKAAELVALGRRQADIRKLLGDMVNKASGTPEGKEPALPPEPEEANPLPEEATLAQVDDKELQAELLGGKPGGQNGQIDIRRAADRMTRSRQRLELQRDAGTVTQVIQHRIIDDLDLLVEAARKQQCKGGGGGQSSPQDVMQVPKPSESQAQNQGKNSQNSGGSKAASSSKSSGGQTGQANAGKDINELSEEWGRISPRLRGPVLESRDETIVERYRRLIEDYTQAVGTEASGGAPSSPPAPATPSPEAPAAPAENGGSR